MKKYIYLLLAVSMLSISSCDILDFSPTDKYNEFTIWQSKKNIKLYLNGFYTVVRNHGQFGSKAFGASYHSTDGLTYMLKYTSNVTGNGTPNIVAMTPGLITPDQNALGFWSEAYTEIRKINEFLSSVDEQAKVLNDTEKVEVKAEARMMRAWWYYLLVRSHGSVIIYDQLSDWQKPQRARTPEDKCWDYIASELDYCADNLPKVRLAEDFGRPTKGAAYALKSRAMLYAERWDAVVKACEEVEKLGYKLEDDYATIFNLKAGGKSNESIFQLDYVKGALTHDFDSRYAPSGDIGDAGGAAGPTQEMVDQYEMADGSKFDWKNQAQAQSPYEGREIRFQKSILYNGATWKDRTIETYEGGKDGFKAYGSIGDPKTTVTGYYIRKLLDEKNNTFNVDKSYQTWVEIRYAEVLLNHAEALIQKNLIPDGINKINEVRKRAGFTENKGFRPTTVNQADAMTFLRHERLIELAFEGFHYWDLRRWGLAVDEIDGKQYHGMKITKEGANKYTYLVVPCDDKPRVFPKKYYSSPIPSGEISNNPMCEQLDEWK